jgi:hypothetical protein
VKTETELHLIHASRRQWGIQKLVPHEDEVQTTKAIAIF